jgi:radical SAM protein with 4Fe4S-binding SPASM domain
MSPRSLRRLVTTLLRWLARQANRLPFELGSRIKSHPRVRSLWSRLCRLSGIDWERAGARDHAPLCVRPWIHTHVETTGDVLPCCIAFNAEAGPIGNINRQAIGELFKSKRLESIRQQMLAGTWPDDCRACQNRESQKLGSYRQDSNREYFDYFEQLISWPPSLQAKIRSVDLRFNNVCNLKCRSCNAYLSNSWYDDHNAIHPDDPVHDKLHGLDDLTLFWADFDSAILGDLEEVHVAGGEPLLIDAHYQLLEKLIAAGKTGIRLICSTNLSQLRFKHWDAIELWRRFPNMVIRMSLDGVGPQGEYIRSGLNYAKWCENVHRLQRELPQTQRSVHFVVSIFNVIELPRHYQEIVDRRFVDPRNITFTFLEWPDYMNVQVLEPGIKADTARLIVRFLKDNRSVPANVRDQLNALVDYMCARDLYKACGGTFARITRLLDARRGEDAAKLFPALAPMLSA